MINQEQCFKKFFPGKCLTIPVSEKTAPGAEKKCIYRREKMKKRLIALIAACAMLVTAFAGMAAADEAADGESFLVGYNFFGAGSYALLSLANNSEYAIKYLGDETMGVNDNFQVEQIIADVENMCNAGCDGILIWLPAESLPEFPAEFREEELF